MPCEACSARSSPCDYDASSDQRRKIANQRNVQDLAQAQHDLEHYRQLLGGILAIFQAGSNESTTDLVHLIRNGTDLSSMAAFVRNEVRASLPIQQAFRGIDFHINGPPELPSPSQLLSRMNGFSRHDSESSGNNHSAFSMNGSMSQ